MPLKTLIFLILLVFPTNYLLADASLTLIEDTVFQTSLEKNIEIKNINIDQEIGKLELPSAFSIYDTNLQFELSYFEDKSQRTSTFLGTETNQTNYNLRAMQNTPLGTQLTLGFLNQRDRSNSPFIAIDPAYDSQIEITLRQPVSKNYFGFNTRKQIDIVKEQIEALNHQTHRRIEAKIYEILAQYWNFYITYRNVEFEKEAMGKAAQLYETNRQKQKIGLIEESDLYAFAANYNVRESLWLDAKNQLIEANEKLKVSLEMNETSPLNPGTESFDPLTPPTIEETISNALSKRADFLALKKEIEALDLQVEMSKNSRWPQIDLLATLNLNGVDNDYDQAVENIGDGNPVWSVGMEFNFPIPNRKANSDYKKSKLEKAQKLLSIKQKELEITKEITQNLEQLQNTIKRMTVTERARKNQYQKMAGELKKYEQGRSDSDTVIRFQNEYIDTKKLSLQAQVAYKMSLLNLKLSQGILLKE